MASMMFTNCSSSTTSRFIYSNRRNNTFLLRRGVGQVRLRTTASSHGCILSIRSSSSSIPFPAKVIDGKAVAKKIRDEITMEVSRMKESINVVPGLAVILVGDITDSATYVRNKKKACESVGIKSFEFRLPEDSSEEEVLKSVSGFNDDPCVHGILVQLPLPLVNKVLCRGRMLQLPLSIQEPRTLKKS